MLVSMRAETTRVGGHSRPAPPEDTAGAASLLAVQGCPNEGARSSGFVSDRTSVRGHLLLFFVVVLFRRAVSTVSLLLAAGL